MSTCRTPVAVVIPCYNLGAYLPEAIESVLDQTCRPAEMIIIDDGSDDAQTLSVLRGLEQSGLTVVHTPNQGAALARNLGISKANSPYILSLDADDVLMPRFLETTVKEIEKSPDVGIVATGVELFGLKEGIWNPRPGPATDLLWENRIPGTSLFRRECWAQAGGYKDLKGCQDWELWLSIVVENGWKWNVVPEVLFRYRQRPGSISEYRDAHRPELLRQIVAFHEKAYSENVADLLVMGDTRFQAVRNRLDSVMESMSPVERLLQYRRDHGWLATFRRLLPYLRGRRD